MRIETIDPIVFALHAIWKASQPLRKDFNSQASATQAEAVADLALNYLGLSFENSDLITLPPELRDIKRLILLQNQVLIKTQKNYPTRVGGRWNVKPKCSNTLQCRFVFCFRTNGGLLNQLLVTLMDGRLADLQ